MGSNGEVRDEDVWLSVEVGVGCVGMFKRDVGRIKDRMLRWLAWTTG